MKPGLLPVLVALALPFASPLARAESKMDYFKMDLSEDSLGRAYKFKTDTTLAGATNDSPLPQLLDKESNCSVFLTRSPENSAPAILGKDHIWKITSIKNYSNSTELESAILTSDSSGTTLTVTQSVRLSGSPCDFPKLLKTLGAERQPILDRVRLKVRHPEEPLPVQSLEYNEPANALPDVAVPDESGKAVEHDTEI